MFETIGKGSHDPSTLKGTLVRGPGISPYLSRSNNERGMFNLFNLFYSIHSFQLLKAANHLPSPPPAASTPPGPTAPAIGDIRSAREPPFPAPLKGWQQRSPIQSRSDPFQTPIFIHFIYLRIFSRHKYFLCFDTYSEHVFYFIYKSAHQNKLVIIFR